MTVARPRQIFERPSAMSQSASVADTVIFPKSHDWPPFWTIQRVLTTQHNHFRHWSNTIQLYCRTLKIWRMNLVDHLSSPLFHNSTLRRSLNLEETKMILEWMVSEEGGRRAEWINESSSGKIGDLTGRTTAWIYWRRPEEWAEVIMDWIENTGQKGSVVTLYEITQGEATTTQEFHGMDPDILQKTLQILVKRGKAQVFGVSGEQGVKFF